MCGALRALGGHRAQLPVFSCRAGLRWVTGAGAGAWENLEAVVPLVAQGQGSGPVSWCVPQLSTQLAWALPASVKLAGAKARQAQLCSFRSFQQQGKLQGPWGAAGHLVPGGHDWAWVCSAWPV